MITVGTDVRVLAGGSTEVSVGSIGTVTEVVVIEETGEYAYKVVFLDQTQWAFRDSDVEQVSLDQEFTEIMTGANWAAEPKQSTVYEAGEQVDGCPGDDKPHVHLSDNRAFILPSVTITDDKQNVISAVDTGGLIDNMENDIACTIGLNGKVINLTAKEAAELGLWLLNTYTEEDEYDDHEEDV